VRNYHEEKGFTIIELAIVMVISSVLFVTVATAINHLFGLGQQTETQRMSYVTVALSEHLRVSGTLPCPADINLDSHHKDYGRADCNAAGVKIVNGQNGGNVLIGSLPIVDLRIAVGCDEERGLESSLNNDSADVLSDASGMQSVIELFRNFQKPEDSKTSTRIYDSDALSNRMNNIKCLGNEYVLDTNGLKYIYAVSEFATGRSESQAYGGDKSLIDQVYNKVRPKIVSVVQDDLKSSILKAGRSENIANKKAKHIVDRFLRRFVSIQLENPDPNVSAPYVDKDFETEIRPLLVGLTVASIIADSGDNESLNRYADDMRTRKTLDQMYREMSNADINQLLSEADVQSFYPLHPQAGQIKIVDNEGRDISQGPPNGQYELFALVSVGEDRVGSFGSNGQDGGSSPCDDVAADSENCDMDSVFMDAFFAMTGDHDNPKHFDDTIQYSLASLYSGEGAIWSWSNHRGIGYKEDFTFGSQARINIGGQVDEKDEGTEEQDKIVVNSGNVISQGSIWVDGDSKETRVETPRFCYCPAFPGSPCALKQKDLNRNGVPDCAEDGL